MTVDQTRGSRNMNMLFNRVVIVFHAYQSEKWHEINSKTQNPMAPAILDIFKVIYLKNNLIWPFQSFVPILCSFLYLVYFRGHHGPTYVSLLSDVFFRQIIVLRLTWEGEKTFILGFILLYWPVFEHFSDLRRKVF